MTLPESGRRCYAPWREDLRPISGFLQGTYAFLGVSGFWRRRSPPDGPRLSLGVRIATHRVGEQRVRGIVGVRVHDYIHGAPEGV
jgi:HEXXH motif-containing protein